MTAPYNEVMAERSLKAKALVHHLYDWWLYISKMKPYRCGKAFLVSLSVYHTDKSVYKSTRKYPLEYSEKLIGDTYGV